ncbi:MAG: hypothetical protein IMF26_03775 [Candidatus Fermentithermobacillus carboniphilus]|uniref:Uncharacterized protein n=1 Tax=Candidatus Fermentithermobacillus carboniphilus TaxID=3085328 RepID=A0AAT9LDC9_9FIRM|nr:MAG: hypothetical protein IMF26_03775 [Candidatus Fermentithermobacillus carboniphilus]
MGSPWAPGSQANRKTSVSLKDILLGIATEAGSGAAFAIFLSLLGLVVLKIFR